MHGTHRVRIEQTVEIGAEGLQVAGEAPTIGPVEARQLVNCRFGGRLRKQQMGHQRRRRVEAVDLVGVDEQLRLPIGGATEMDGGRTATRHTAKDLQLRLARLRNRGAEAGGQPAHRPPPAQAHAQPAQAQAQAQPPPLREPP
jgi:hypothetical protein